MMIVAFLCLFTYVGSAEAKTNDVIKIGICGPFSGFLLNFGEQQKAALDMAIEEQNAKGGLLGKKIVVFYEDDEYRPEVAIRKAKKLILEDKVHILGSFLGTHIASALNQVGAKYKKIVINNGGMGDIIQGKLFNRYAFRLRYNAHAMITGLILYMKETKVRKIYIISPDYVYGHDTAKTFKTQLEKYIPDATIVGEDYHPLRNKEFGPYVSKIIASKADGVFTVSYGSDSRLLIKTAREMGLKAPFPFFTYAALNIGLMREMGEGNEQVNGIVQAADYAFTVNTPGNKAFVKKWNDKFKHEKDANWWWPGLSGGMCYAGWQMVFAAIEKAGTLDTEKIIDTFEGMWFKSILGWWAMRKCDHQLILPIFVLQASSQSNPWYPFPWVAPEYRVFPASEAALPPTHKYNKRCP